MKLEEKRKGKKLTYKQELYEQLVTLYMTFQKNKKGVILHEIIYFSRGKQIDAVLRLAPKDALKIINTADGQIAEVSNLTEAEMYNLFVQVRVLHPMTVALEDFVKIPDWKRLNWVVPPRDIINVEDKKSIGMIGFTRDMEDTHVIYIGEDDSTSTLAVFSEGNKKTILTASIDLMSLSIYLRELSESLIKKYS